MQTAVQNQKDIVRQVYDALNRRDQNLFRKLHTKDVVLHDADRDLRGIDACIDHEWTFMEAFPDLKLVIDNIISEGNWVAVRHRGLGTHKGDFNGIEPTGTQVEIPVLMMARFDGERIAEVWLQADRLGLLRQLGVADSPAR